MVVGWWWWGREGGKVNDHGVYRLDSFVTSSPKIPRPKTAFEIFAAIDFVF
jgi:hypothetical protein